MEERTSKWYYNGKNYSSRAAMMAAKAASGDTSSTTSTMGTNWASPAYGGASAVHAADPTFAEKFGDSVRYKQSPFTSDVNYSTGYTGEGWNTIGSTGWRSDVPDSDATKEGWFNASNMEAFGHATKGLGALASGWAALKNLKLTRQAMEDSRNQWQTNYEAQRLATNNQIANQNAWKQAQGRTDFGSYVGGKPSGTQYVG